MEQLLSVLRLDKNDNCSCGCENDRTNEYGFLNCENEKYKIDPSAHGNFAICKAAEKGYTDCVKFLLSDQRVDPSANCNYALIKAVENGHTDIVKLLVADPRVDCYSDAIEVAIKNDHLEYIDLFLNDSAIEYYLCDDGIETAIRKGYNEIVKKLLSDERMDVYNTLIKVAIEVGNMECVDILMNDPRSAAFCCDTELAMAIEKGYIEIAKKILSDERTYCFGGETLDKIIEKGNVELLKLFLKNVANEDDCQLALLKAAETGKAECVRVLLSDPRTKPRRDNNAALRLAIENDNVECAGLLVMYADI